MNFYVAKEIIDSVQVVLLKIDHNMYYALLHE